MLVNFKVPPAAPGPVPEVPAISVKPRGVTGPVGGEEAATLPDSVISAAPSIVLPRLISFAAHISILPLVVVIPDRLLLGSAPVLADRTILTLRPALNKTLPPELGVATTPVVVISAFTLISWPQHTTRFPRVTVVAALMLTSPVAFKAFKVRFTWVSAIGVLILILPVAFTVRVVLGAAPARVGSNVPLGPGPPLKSIFPAAFPVLAV